LNKGGWVLFFVTVAKDYFVYLFKLYAFKLMASRLPATNVHIYCSLNCVFCSEFISFYYTEIGLNGIEITEMGIGNSFTILYAIGMVVVAVVTFVSLVLLQRI